MHHVLWDLLSYSAQSKESNSETAITSFLLCYVKLFNVTEVSWFAPVGVVYTRWGRKDCTGNNTDLVYTGISGGGLYSDTGRSAEPVCLPHDPLNGNVLSSNAHASVYGMEYEDNFGGSLHDKDVPCAVCRANHVTSKLLIPGKVHVTLDGEKNTVECW
ncbi:unnamed protein product [Mytilus edulis]|uniref:Uncharacterized protein n=1 Tax=Mytilus edulis TaxID=6550 RepID=A0A8S3ULS0_MYTED|nr:unnamed protein product [Mytilus edulis]